MPHHDARAIANEFIKLAERDGMRLTNMQLQKLPYIAHGWSLALLDKPLIKDIPQAWPYGPVYPDLYQSLRRYGAKNVFEPIRENDTKAIAFLENGKCHRGKVVRAHLEKEEKKFLEAVWQNYKNYGAFQLSEMTHRPGTPWTIVHDKAGNYAPIPHDIIASHYKGMIQK